MTGPGFVSALTFWTLVMSLGVFSVAMAIVGYPALIAILFGATWLGLMTYFAWKIGSSER